MYFMHPARVRPVEMSTVQPGPTNPVFMFGTFDPADGTSYDSIRALDEAILGIKEDGHTMAAANHKHSHAEVAADASSSAFMFGVNPEQPTRQTLPELPWDLCASKID